ncbi:hypothetical protein BDV97DRAFT_341763 [Delphinella strobiligena]|nr:hypothetical protein BDV97DRAFT_341763 [Delphinella strobiligena]
MPERSSISLDSLAPSKDSRGPHHVNIRSIQVQVCSNYTRTVGMSGSAACKAPCPHVFLRHNPSSLIRYPYSCQKHR